MTTNVLYQLTQFLGAINYLATVTGNVLANSAPGNNYQTLLGIENPYTQTINLSYTAEAGTRREDSARLGERRQPGATRPDKALQ